ncbi:MAG: TonB family protein [Vicinamibacterales bacterium]
MSLLTRFLNLFRRRSLDRDLDDEVRFHLSERIASNVRQGMPYRAAEQSAYKQFGSVERVKQGMKEVRVTRRLPLLTFVVGILVGAVAMGILRPTMSTSTTPDQDYYTIEQEGVMTPVLIREVKPSYTPDAIRDKIAGTVVLTCIVQPSGVCEETQVVKPLDPRLDQQAMSVLRDWRFRPGEYRGKPVPVQVTIEMVFTLS